MFGHLGSVPRRLCAVGARDRSRRSQLQDLLGDRGTVLPYVAQASRAYPTRGWYIQLAIEFEFGIVPGFWTTLDGRIFAGHDTPHAAACIERLRAAAQA